MSPESLILSRSTIDFTEDWAQPHQLLITHLLVEPNNAEEIANDASNPDQNLDIGNGISSDQIYISYPNLTKNIPSTKNLKSISKSAMVFYENLGRCLYYLLLNLSLKT